MRLHRIELPTPFPVGPVNAYLLAGEPLTLVDAGPRTPQAQAALEAGVARAGHRLEEIRRVVLTHGHTDHAGNAAWVAQRSGAAVYAHPADRPKVSGQRWALEHLRAFVVQAGLPPSALEAFAERLGALRQYHEPVPELQPLDDGQSLALDGERLRVLHTPGHSHGHVCLYHEDGVLIAGDLLLADISPNPVVEFGPDGRRLPTLPLYLQSLRRVLLLNCDVAHPGHGPALDNPNARIRELIAHHDQRKERVAALLRGGARTLAELCRELYPDVDEASLILALSEVVGHLDLLAEEKRLASTRRKGVIVYRLK
ncbi:MAG: MBL fold metallo-hydrolase [Armatimonadota bacterium]|nr:MBL fold metallo-hydrolase [Armatimonadota bacterium]MDR7516472.1 MBL fold metallo-hydrolase [Armatimonadota bacterium]MDR7582587.1 MBL fold metallo-hydrolase [Armatimonadota bacterium]MDR7586961.1 MBL fold metallo-hydrolase [Armatimonadota bacterium]MDR7612355.1 MBL fold metallo-hydrolase [Armatimonadota bacterium]